MSLPSAPRSPLQAPEIITVPGDTDEVACDGGNGALGHPVVWYSFDAAHTVECGYCDRRFIRRDGATHE